MMLLGVAIQLIRFMGIGETSHPDRRLRSSMMICLRAWARCSKQMRATTAKRCARVSARKSLMFMGFARCVEVRDVASVMLAVSKRARRKGRFGRSVNGIF